MLWLAFLLLAKNVDSDSKKGELSVLLVCTFKSLFLFSTLAPYKYQVLRDIFEYAIKLQAAQYNEKPQFFTSSSIETFSVSLLVKLSTFFPMLSKYFNFVSLLIFKQVRMFYILEVTDMQF